MVKFNINDISDYLASRADTDYRFVKFKGCIFNAPADELISTFLYEESIKGKISGMKARLEQEFKTAVGLPELNFLFLYKRCYMDAVRLEVLIQEFLRKHFSFLTLDLTNEDLIITKGEEGFTAKLRLTKQAADYIKGSKAFKTFVEGLLEDNFATFNFIFDEIKGAEQKELTLEEIEKFAEDKILANKQDKVDKVCKINNREYLLGAPIKERPIKLEFLSVSAHEQIIAGTISFFTRREFNKKKKVTNEDGVEVETSRPMPYWTFVIDDGSKKQSCVYFPSGRTEESLQKNISKIETLGNGSVICAIGINDERNGRVNFSVRGISTCKME